MLKVALTGGIATGKSYVLDRFAQHGIPCLEADALAHGVMAPGTEAAAAIANRFGADVLGADGAVNRQRLGRIVFADAAARRDLEAIVHPGVHRAIAAGLRAFELTGGAPFAVVAIPLLHETGRTPAFDKIVATTCRPGTQLDRLMARGLSAADARLRLAAQLPASAKAEGADFVIDTDGAFADTDRQVDRIMMDLTGPAGAGPDR